MHIGYAGTYPLQLPLGKQELASKKGSTDQDPNTNQLKPPTEHCSNTAASNGREDEERQS